MMEKDEFLAGMAKRLRELRLFLGYETAASFVRAIGYPPDKYSRYERCGINNADVLKRFVEAIKSSGHGKVRYDWLLDCRADLMLWPDTKPTVPPVRTEGNVVHATFAR